MNFRLPVLLWLGLALVAAPGAAATKDSLPFIQDNYAKALAEAKQRKLPLFIDVWAPWCHTCRSMKAYVFTDPALRPVANQFVWSAIDTEKEINVSFRERFTIEGYPSFYVVDPATETVVLRWLGAATVEQLKQLLDDGVQAIHAKGDDRVAVSLARADRLYGEGKLEAAATAFADTLRLAPKEWSRRGRTVESLLFALQSTKEFEKAVEAALGFYPDLRDTSSALNIVALGLDCAVNLPKANTWRAGSIAALEKSARDTMASPKVTAAADDRSGLYMIMISAREDAGDAAGTQALVAEWSAFLDGHAARASTADARAVFDSHRLSAYLKLGQPERAIPMLTASEKELPGDYNPPARLAIAYNAMKQYPQAMAAADRALAKAYGPRQLTIYRAKVDALIGDGDVEGAKATLQTAIKLGQSLPKAQQNEKLVASLQEKLDSL